MAYITKVQRRCTITSTLLNLIPRAFLRRRCGGGALECVYGPRAFGCRRAQVQRRCDKRSGEVFVFASLAPKSRLDFYPPFASSDAKDKRQKIKTTLISARTRAEVRISACLHSCGIARAFACAKARALACVFCVQTLNGIRFLIRKGN